MRVFTIASNTFKEAVRDKILYSLIFFAILMIGLGSILDRITIGQNEKIIKDFGLASLTIFGVGIAIFVGIGLVFKEIDKRTIFTIIAKPISRWQFLIGKYIGLLFTLFVEIFLMAIGMAFFLILLSKGMPDVALLKGIFLIYIELCVITAVALFFSSFSTPFLSGFLTLAVFVIGHLSEDLKVFSERFDQGGKFLVNCIYYIFPNLETLNIKGLVVHGKDISWLEVFQRASFGMLYCVVILMITILIFEKREFK